MLEKEHIKKIDQEIFAKFPYLIGNQPSQKNMPDGTTQLRYSASTKTASGMVLPISIIVKVSAEGNIINISTTK